MNEEEDNPETLGHDPADLLKEVLGGSQPVESFAQEGSRRREPPLPEELNPQLPDYDVIL